MLKQITRKEIRLQERASRLFKAVEHASRICSLPAVAETALACAMLAAEEEELVDTLQSEYAARVATSGTTQPLWSVLLGTRSEHSYWLTEVHQSAEEGVYIVPSRGGIPARVVVRVLDMLCLRTSTLTRQYLVEMPCRKIGIFPSASAVLLGVHAEYGQEGYAFCEQEEYEEVWGL